MAVMFVFKAFIYRIVSSTFKQVQEYNKYCITLNTALEEV